MLQQVFYGRGQINNVYEVGRYTNDLEFINKVASMEVNLFEDPKFFPNGGLNYVDSKQNIYFLSTRNEYIVKKYDIDGNHLLSFGRNYKRKPYTAKTRKWYNDNYKNSIRSGALPQYPKYPPIVRYILVDDYDYVWVIVGEWYTDNVSDFRIMSTIDIFNEYGEFLYTFDSSVFGQYSMIKNGRLYAKPTLDSNKNLTIYDVKYNIKTN